MLAFDARKSRVAARLAVYALLFITLAARLPR